MLASEDSLVKLLVQFAIVGALSLGAAYWAAKQCDSLYSEVVGETGGGSNPPINSK